jgi:hypothetical protein
MYSRRMERFYYTFKPFKNTGPAATTCSFKKDAGMIMHGKVERIQEKWLWSNSKYYPSSHLEELWEIMENLNPRLRLGYLTHKVKCIIGSTSGKMIIYEQNITDIKWYFHIDK